MSTIDRILSNYSRQVRLPWSPNVSGKQRIWFAVYPPAEERRVRARLPQFEALTLEPVSQMPQEDQHATELTHPEKVGRVRFPAAADRRKFFSEQPLNLPSPQVAAQRPPILGSLSAATVGGNHLDAMFAPQPLIQPIAVVGTISDPAFRQGAYVTLAQRVFDQGGLIRRSACNPDGDRKTMAVRDCHDLAPFAAARRTNAIAPLFAPMNEASTKLSSSPSSPRASKASQSAHKMPSRTPDCTPCWKRRWQVEDGPYRGGRSCQGAQEPDVF